MAITYPLNMPSPYGFASIRIRAANAVARASSAFSFQEQVQSFGGDRWSADIVLPPLPRANAAEWIAFLLSLRGSFGTFLLGDPLAQSPRGSALGSPSVSGDDTASSRTLTTVGWTAGETGVLLRGDYIQLGSGTSQRIYTVLQDVDADSAGEATIDIWPRLREAPASGESLVLNTTKGVFRLDEDTQEWSEMTAELWGISFNAIEAI